MLLGPVGIVSGLIVCTLWSAAFAALLAPVFSGGAPDGSLLGDLSSWDAAAVAASSVLIAAVALAVTRALAVGCGAMAHGLLADEEREQMTERIATLETSRSGAVESADARLRRIERDLHDGAQHRLAYIAMELGRARAKLPEDPAAVDTLLAGAHDESKRAMRELRDLVRGIHPSVLSDRGLDAALSGLAERASVPVEINSSLAERLPPAVETAAYYVVAETLTNVGRHSGASRAEVDVAHRPRPARADRRGRRPRRRRAPPRLGARGPRPAGRGARRHARGDEPRGRADHDHGLAAMRVVIAEDLVLLREGIAALLADHGHQVVAAVGDGEGLLDAMAEHAPDLAVVDVRMPPTQTDEGVRAAVEARRRRPDAAILILSQYVEERYASDLLSSGTVGVGYLLKDRVAEVQEFVAAAERVAAGGTVIDPEVVAQLLGRGRDEPLDALTPREREVLGLMAEGHSNAAIVERLGISHSAVEKHVRKVFTKLGLPETEHHHRRVLAVLTYLGV